MRYSPTSLIVLFFIALSLTMSGCAFGQKKPTEAPTEQVQTVTFSGMLYPSDNYSGVKGTHKLELENGKEIMLQSKDVNLNLYVNSQVTITGVLAEMVEDQELIDVLTVTVGEGKTEETPVTWEEKSFADLGLSFQLPSIFLAQAMGVDAVKLTEASGKSIMVTVQKFPLPRAQKIEQYLETQFGKDGYEQVTVGKYLGYRLTASGSDVTLFIASEKIAYKVLYSSLEADDAQYKKHFYTLLESLKFLEEKVPESTTPNTMDIFEDMEGTSSSTSQVQPTTPAASTTPSSVIKTETSTPTVSTPTTPVAPAGDKAPVVTPEKTTPPVTKPAASASQKVMWYFNSNPSVLPLDGASGTPLVQNFEFVEPNYVYVTYGVGAEKRRALFQYGTQGESVTTTQVGSFKAGEERDWEKLSGENPVGAKAKTVYEVKGEEVVEKATVKEGFRLYENSGLGFTVQYPVNWYYKGFGANEQGAQEVGFSNQPVEKENTSVSMGVSKSAPAVSGTQKTIGGKSVNIVEETLPDDGGVRYTYYVAGGNGKTFTFSGTAADKATIEAMIETLEVTK
jgi:hypothetical protein